MRPHELDAAVSVWREANIARGAPHGPERTARIRAKLSASEALPFVAQRPGIVGMALAEPGRLDDGAGELDPALLHISMVFVHPAEQRTGVGLPLVLHVLNVARSLGYQRVDVWTARENTPARRLYERAGMTHTGKTAPLLSSRQLQYDSFLDGEDAPRGSEEESERAVARSQAADEPIRLAPYDPSWPERFAEEKALLSEAIGTWDTGGIHHVGSTAVPGLDAKPIIDILVGVENLDASRACFEPLAKLGYLYAPYRADEMHWFCKPHPSRRTHHLHLVPTDSRRFRDELAFRDRLRDSNEAAEEYVSLKRDLAERFANDREAYTDAKADFIRRSLGHR
jgi:GrpB-like predicted nucleotidyltransferase (UPF0157 family)/ribosomal protein S18 acetylase RimI-like enzyme